MTATSNLSLPYLQPNQAQKHITLNEALRTLDAVVQISVSSRGLVTPPTSPANGVRFIPALGASGLWDTQANTIAAFQDGVWASYAPQQGWLVFVEDEGVLVVWNGAAWEELVAPALHPAALMSVNTIADEATRLAVRSSATLFDHEGDGHQLKLNKASPEKTASLLFQSQYSTRAEMGLVGSNDFAFKMYMGFAGFGTATPVSRLHVRQDYDARLTIDTIESGAGGGFDIINSIDGQNWRVTGSSSNFKLRDHTALLDKFLINAGSSGKVYITNTPRFGIGTTSPTTTLHINGPVRLGAYAKASLPDAAAVGAGAVILVTDESGGPVLAFSDAVTRRRVTDRAIVS